MNIDEVSVIILAPSKLVKLKLAQGLKSGNLLFFEATSVEDAISLYHQFEPNLLMVDTSVLLQRELAERVRSISPDLKLVGVGTASDLQPIVAAKLVDGVLVKPFLPESVPLKVLSLLNATDSQELEARRVFQMRKYKRHPVHNVKMRFYSPFQERTQIINIGYSGLCARSAHSGELAVGTQVKLEIFSPFGNINLGGQVSWVKEAEVGVIFSNPKPKNFLTFVDKLE